MTVKTSTRPRVGLFVTCLVDMFRPQVGLATVKLLEQAGCEVSVPRNQTCCGQPAFNSGDNKDSREIAKSVIEAFEAFDYVVAPSGSCAAMIKEHYPELFEAEPDWFQRSTELSARTFELVSFLVDEMKFDDISAHYEGKITYHDSCSGLRELSVKQQPRQLLDKVSNLERTELPGAETCCGFGGTFCVKYPEISNKMVEEKTADIIATGADTLVAGDLGCLMNMAGKLQRQGSDIKVRHVAEILADQGSQPAIGEPEGR